MNIAVLLKQVPDTESVIRIADDGKSMVTENLKWIINPYEEFAVEAALRLKEKLGGSVTVVSWGPARVVEAIRTALAMGADKAVIVSDPALDGCDNLGVTKALAAAVDEIKPDLILCGSRAVDYDQAERGAMVAELMNLPHLALAVSIESDGKTVTVERPIEGGKVVLEATLPALVTLGGSHAVWNPRYASLPGIMKAKKKPVATKNLLDLGLDPEQFGPRSANIRIDYLEMPSERMAGRIIGGGMDTAGKARELVRALHEEVRVI